MTLDQLANLIIPEWAIIMVGIFALFSIALSFLITHKDWAGIGYILPISFTIAFYVYEYFFDGSNLLGHVFLRAIIIVWFIVVIIFRIAEIQRGKKWKI